LATAQEGDITSLLRVQDRQERFSLSDPGNLSSKEEVYLTFGPVDGNDSLGLVLNFRQTMMTTYLFYSAMGYMGDQVAEMFALLETDENKRKQFDSTTKELGGIDCYVLNEDTRQWVLQSGVKETGPIAINRQFIPFGNIRPKGTVKVKLILNRGLWRMDYVSLVNISKRVTPVELSPTSILNKGVPDNEALALIRSPRKHLISMPGNAYNFNFRLPEADTDYELFLYSKGYYLEWMREHWIKDKNLLKLNQMVDHPRKYLRDEASRYKPYETTMEQQFWNSKIDTKTFSYYEH
ncbi:MAG: hypothetical protein ACKO3B_01710, partial [Bacteroidota bacterium]